MIRVTTRKGQNIALFGLGGSGMATAEALVAGGANLTAFDDNPSKVEEATQKGIPTGNLHDYDFTKADAFVLSPGVPLTHPKPHWSVELAKAANVPIIGDVALFADERRAHAPESIFIAITGTNGKSTTTALISHILQYSGRKVQMGGNIGRAVLTLDELTNDAIYVVECSSYQIDLAPQIDPTIGLLLNLAPDHLDRHGTMQNYASIKSQLIERAKTGIIGVDDSFTREIAQKLVSNNLIEVSVKQNLTDGVIIEGENILLSTRGEKLELTSVEGIASLRGQHNLQNAAAATIACRLAGLTDDEIQAGLNSFPGLAHRMEILGNVGNISYVNDSKGTNADAAAMALGSYEAIYWIAGGLPKSGGIEQLRPLFGNIVKAYLIGQAAPEFAASLGGAVPFEITETLEMAVDRAAADSSETGKGVVLLSPACASFDQFKNFEHRGDVFRDAVYALDGFVGYGEENK